VNTMDDRQLILQLQKGSLAALGLLYDRHKHLVYRTAFAITGDYEAAADLLQDVFLRLFKFAAHIDPSRPLEPWLYRMTTNQSYTWVKRSQRLIRSVEDITDWLVGARKNTVSQTVIQAEELQQLQHAIARLPLPQRMVVVLYYLNDLSIQEISETLEIPSGTVKSRLHYGREALKSHLLTGQKDRLVDLKCEFT
jgi:RNA polymerase sigma-70 factor (ECF subfamily)